MDLKILIVDDEPHVRLLMEQTLEELEDEGVELLFADNGEVALNIIKNDRPQLVFMDVMMPKMNGFDVCHQLRQNNLENSSTQVLNEIWKRTRNL